MDNNQQQPPVNPPDAPDKEKMDQVRMKLVEIVSTGWLTHYVEDSTETNGEALRACETQS
jgi:hypothetical protein